MCATVWPAGGQKLIGLSNSVVLVPLPVDRDANVAVSCLCAARHGGGQRLEAGGGLWPARSRADFSLLTVHLSLKAYADDTASARDNMLSVSVGALQPVRYSGSQAFRCFPHLR